MWLLASSLLVGFAGFMIALAIMLPFLLRYSSDFSQPPRWVPFLMAILGYGLPAIFFTANMIRYWRWADREVLPSTDNEDQSPSTDD